MVRTLYLLYFAIVILTLAGFSFFFAGKTDQFTRALQIMDQAQSQSLAAWELSDDDFQILTDAYTQSFIYTFDVLGQYVSEDGYTIDTEANGECDRCFHIADLRETAPGDQEYKALLTLSTLQPGKYEVGIGEMLSKISVSSRQKQSLRRLTDEINTWTHDGRLRLRFIRWFYEYKQTRELGPTESIDEVDTETSVIPE